MKLIKAFIASSPTQQRKREKTKLKSSLNTAQTQASYKSNERSHKAPLCILFS